MPEKIIIQNFFIEKIQVVIANESRQESTPIFPKTPKILSTQYKGIDIYV